MEVTKLHLNGNEYNFTDADAQSKISEIKENTYTKEFVDQALSDIDEALKDYAKSADVAANYQPKGLYLTEHQDISNLATKAEVKTVSDKVDAIKVPTKVSELTNDSKYQTESQVNSAIQKVVGTAPEALDTLGEIADKLSDNDDVVAGLVSTISTKADKSALGSYYNKSEVDDKIDAIDFTPYETVEGAVGKYQPIGSYVKVDGSNGTKEGVSTLLRKLGDGDQVMTDNTLLVTSYFSGQTTENPLFYRRPANLLWSYIKGKADSVYLKEHQSLEDYLTKDEVSEAIDESNAPIYIDEFTFMQLIDDANKNNDSYTLPLSTQIFNNIYEKLRTAYIGNRPVYIKFYDDYDIKYRLHFTMFDDTMAYLTINYGDIAGIYFNPQDKTVNLLNTVMDWLDKKVDRVEGKQLSTNDYTAADKNTVANLRKLNSISHIKDNQAFTATTSEVRLNFDCVSASAGDGNYTQHSEILPVASATSAGVITASDKAKLDAAPAIWTGTEAQYNALSTKNSNTLYLIPE